MNIVAGGESNCMIMFHGLCSYNEAKCEVILNPTPLCVGVYKYNTDNRLSLLSMGLEIFRSLA